MPASFSISMNLNLVRFSSSTTCKTQLQISRQDIFVHPPWAPNCTQHSTGGLKIFIPQDI